MNAQEAYNEGYQIGEWNSVYQLPASYFARDMPKGYEADFTRGYNAGRAAGPQTRDEAMVQGLATAYSSLSKRGERR